MRRCASKFLLAAAVITLGACQDGERAAPTAPGPRVNRASAKGGAPTVFVANVEQLYDAVNDPSSSSAAIVLAAGTYVLTPTDGAGLPRPNGGRLELQDNMSLYGITDDRSAVVIDATGLPIASLSVALGRTGPVRVGRGSNTIDWLTILGNAAAAGGIETDLAGTARARVRVANVVSAGSQRGIDVRNVGSAMAGRRIDVEIVGSDFSAAPSANPAQGIRLVNANGADGGVIVATLRGNRVHSSQFGCLVANLTSSNAVIEVQSLGDRFFENGLGCFFNGGIVTGTTGVANSNSTTFEAHGSAFVDNTQPSSLGSGGILAIGGESPNRANGTSQNTVNVRLWGSLVARNLSPDFAAFGARSLYSSGVAGSGNVVRLDLKGVSKLVGVDTSASSPADPSGTNAVTVIR